MSSVLITGASGFVGLQLCKMLSQRNYSITALSRSGVNLPGVSDIRLDDFSDEQALDVVLAGKECVVHSAARVHVMHESAHDPLEEFRRVNRKITSDIANRAAIAGVKRFVFLSSIKVFGETSPRNRPFVVTDTPHPVDAYAVSKWEAEQDLWQIADATGLEVVVIRPPLVYGPGVRANFELMVKLVASGLPLPFGGINNYRSIVAVANLVDLVRVCIEHPNASGQTFTVSDGLPMSTGDIVRRISQALGRSDRMVKIPESILSSLLGLVGKRALAQRLIQSLHVDISPTLELLNWTPPMDTDTAFRETVEHIFDSRN